MPIFSTLAASAGTIGTAVLLGGGGAATAAAMSHKPKMPLMSPSTPAPTPASSAEVAQREVEKIRRMRAMSGGKTILTSEGIGSTGGGKTLLGS